MNTKNYYQFTLVLSGVDCATEDLEDALYEAGCDDALLNFKNRTAYLDFEREAESLEHAIISAIHHVESASAGARVSSVSPSYLVTISEVAKRVNLTKQFISLLANGERGDGSFPSPVINIDTKSSLWRWKDVALWLFSHAYLKDENKLDAATVIDDINVALEFRAEDNETAKHRNEILEKLSLL